MKLWHPVSRRAPCPVCDRPDWCAVSSDGRVARCMRVVDGPDVIAREDSDGTPYGLRFLTDGPCDPSAYRKHDPEPERASPDVLHRVYSALLQVLPLSPAHRASLRARGLTDDEIDARGYRSLPLGDQARRKVMRDLRAALASSAAPGESDKSIPDGVPGVFKGKLSGFSGILIPVRTHTATARALKVRADDPHAPKYTWLSSSSDDGPSPGAPCHVPIFNSSSRSTATVRVTEGPLKADIATALSGMLTLGVPGCASARSAVEHLRALKAQVVRLAWDMDARTNPSVAHGLRLAAEVLREEGFSVAVETWDESTGKGIDDALAAGLTPGNGITVHTGEAVDKVLEGMARRPVAPAAPPGPVASAQPSVAAERRSWGARSFDRGDSVELARALLDDLREAAPNASADAVVYDRATLWQYDPARGIYLERDRADLFRICAAYAGTPTGPKGKPLSLSEGAIKGAILTAQHLAARPGFFDAAPRGVACANGFVRVEGGEIFVDPHSHAHRATHALSFPYDKSAVAPRWDAALREIFRRQLVDDTGAVVGLDEDDTDGSVALLEEFVGASLFGLATSYAMCLVLHGPGNDGKSTILNVLRALFPPSAVCSIAPQDWSRGFLLAGLAGKLLNVVNELPEREMMEGSRFKAVVSGDPLTAEKKFGDPFTFCTIAGGLFACNDLLATRDQTPGFWRRFAVLPCTRSFAASEVVHDLWRTIVAEELAGILARAVEGLARLQGNGRYSIPASASEAKADWQRDSDQVRQFVADCCLEVKKGAPGAAAEEVTVEELYPPYRSWCSETGHTPVARNKLGGRLKVLGYEHRTTTARLYRLKLNAAWKAKGLTPREGGGYRAPLN